MNSNIKQLIVLDSIRDRLEMIQSDILPGSVVHPVRSGDGNTPTAIRSANGTSYSVQNTYFPLYPLEGDVHYLKESFLHFVIRVNFQIAIKDPTVAPIRLAVGPRDVASIFNQVELCLDNMAFLPSVYHHLESAISLSALPASVVDHSPDYATVDKLLNGKPTPMQWITIPADRTRNVVDIYNYTLNYDLSIDLNRLCVPLSNIDFITRHFGNIRLNVYLNNFQQCFYYFVYPINSIQSNIHADTGTQTAIPLSSENINGFLTLAPIDWGDTSDTTQATAIFSAPTWIPLAENKNLNTSAYTVSESACRSIPIQFILHRDAINGTQNSNGFMAVQLAEICQTCFSLEANSVAALDEYFATQGKIILPIQRFNTVTFDGGTINPTGQQGGIPGTLTANIPGKNITVFIASIVPTNCQSCLLNPFMYSYQAILNGRPLNGIRYERTNARAVKDYSDACIDTDEDEINSDLLYALTFPPVFNDGITGDRPTPINTNSYFYQVAQMIGGSSTTINDFNMFKRLKSFFGIGSDFVKLPFNFFHVWETAIPDSFHTGYCIAETAPSLSQFRLENSTNLTELDPAQSTNDGSVYGRFKIINDQAGTVTTGGTNRGRYDNNGTDAEPFMTIPSYTNRACVYYLTALCDSCIVLNYDAGAKIATSAAVADVAPFLTD